MVSVNTLFLTASVHIFRLANIMKKGKRIAVASNQSRGGRSRVSVQSRASNISGNSSNVNGKIDEALAEGEMDEEVDESVLNESDISSVPGTVAASVFTKANSVIPPSPTHRSLHSHEHRTLRKHSITSLEPSPEEPEEISPDRRESIHKSIGGWRGSFHEPRRRQSNISNNSSEPVDGKKRSFFRRSFESLTDRAREVVDNMKLLPLLEDQIRAEYEQILLQAMRRNVPTEVMSENENELPVERDENSPKEEV